MTKKNAFVYTFIGALTLPLLFQNCAQPKQSLNSDGTTTASNLSNTSAAKVIDSNSLAMNVDNSVDQTAGNVTSSPMTTQVQVGIGDENDQNPDDAINARKLCEDYKKAIGANGLKDIPIISTTPDYNAANESISGLTGRHFLSPDNFGGSSNIASIDNVRGQLILCGLNVKELTNIQGKIFIVDSEIKKADKINGRITLLSSHIAELTNFKGIITRVDY